MKGAVEVGMAEAEPGRQRLRRQDPLAAQQQFLRERPESQTQRGGGGGQQGRPVQRLAQGARQVRVGHRIRRHGIQGPAESGLGHRVQDQTHAVVQRNPRHPLPSRSHRTAEAELERRQQAGQHAAPRTQHQTDAYGDHAHAQHLRSAGGLLPGMAEAMAETGIGGAGFVERLVAMQAVPADRRAADQHLRARLQPGDQAADVAGDPEARSQDPATLAHGPQAVADRLPRQVDHGVDTPIVGDLGEARDDRDRSREIGRLRVSDEGDHLMSRAGQRGDQAPADEPGRAGDENTTAARQLPADGRGLGCDQPVGASRGGQITQAEDEYAGRGGGGHPAPQTVRDGDEPGRLARPAQQQRREQGQDGAVVEGQQGVGDPLRRRQPARPVFLDEVGQGDDHLDGQQDEYGGGQPSPRLGPADQQEERGVHQVTAPMEAQFPFLGGLPRQPLGQLMVEQGVEGAHGDLKRHQGPEQVRHLKPLSRGRPGRSRPGRSGDRTGDDPGRG
ncbi:MAG TPA: hypothetical protein VEB62_00815 [Brevundimonas sp.]|nr:hypothetical protein [Brevundimonas sp.]HYC96472.1 hypothetical protein [Brevundimonas sp.]